MAGEELQFNKMVNTPVRKLILQLGLPTTISMLVTAIYNIADTFFVARYDTAASAAVGIIFPLMAIIQAIGFMLGMGCGNMISSLLGMKKNKEAQNYGSSTFYLGLVIGIIISIIGTILLDPLVKILGAKSDASVGYAKDYGLFIVLGAPVMIGSFVMNNILRAEGKAKFSMIGLTTGGLLNIALDPIFIYTLGLGAKGAAIATLISQCVSFLILLMMFLIRKAIITLGPKYILLKGKIYLDVCKLGLPSLCRQGLASIATILLNRQAGTISGINSDDAIAAMSICSKVFMLVFSACLGIGQGYQPVCGYNYFSGNYKRVKEAMLFTFGFAQVFMVVMSSACFIFCKPIMSFFVANSSSSVESIESVIDIGSSAIRFMAIAQILIPINVICNMSFQSMRKKTPATFLSCCRQGIFFIPLVFILPALFNLTGIELVQAMSDALTALISIPFFIHLLKHLNEKEKEHEALGNN